MKRVLVEGLLVACVGTVLAFAANAISHAVSSRGLRLSYNYFYLDHPKEPQPNQGTNAASATNLAGSNLQASATQIRSSSGTNSGANSSSPQALLEAHLKELGVRLAVSNQVAELFRDPRCEQGLVVFVDARDDDQYQAGHIPGAYLLDYFHWDKYLGSVLPVCQAAQEVVLYCNGGTCDDSVLAAGLLLSANVPKEKLMVYGGGVTEWTTNALPIELGERKSGQLKNAQK